MILQNYEINSLQRAANDSEIIASTVARFYLAKANQWTKLHMGAVCLLRSESNSFSLVLYSLDSFSILQSFNLDSITDYQCDTPFFHSFFNSSNISALSFADIEEANSFYDQISTLIKQSKQSSFPKVKTNNQQIPLKSPSSNAFPNFIPNNSNNTNHSNHFNAPHVVPLNNSNHLNASSAPPLPRRISDPTSQGFKPPPPSRNQQNYSPETVPKRQPIDDMNLNKRQSSYTDIKTVESNESEKVEKSSSLFGFKTGKKKEKSKIDKSMIGTPANFQHVSHVGYNPETGFKADNIPLEWKAIFAKAGITETELADKKKQKVIKKFMKNHAASLEQKETNETKKTGAPPPPPPVARKMSSGTNAPPPPPPLNKRNPPPSQPPFQPPTLPSRFIEPTPPPFASRQPIQPPVIPSRNNDSPPPPIPSRQTGTGPPPIPNRNAAVPEPPVRNAPSLPNRNVPPAPSAPAPPPPPSMSGIPPPPPMSGHGVPPPPPMAGLGVPPPPPNMIPSGAPDRSNLLDQIRSSGTGALKKGSNPPPKEAEPEKEEDLAAAIRAALDSRKGALMDSEEEEGDDDDDEW